MRIIQNGYNQKRNAYDQTEFFICTHNYHPPLHRILGMGGSSSSGYPGKYIFLRICPGGSGNAGAGYIYKINLSMGLKPPVFLNFMLWSNDSVKLEASILLKSVVINLSRVKRTERMVGSS